MTSGEFLRLKVGQEVRIVADDEPEYIGCIGLITNISRFTYDDKVWLDVPNPYDATRIMGAFYKRGQIELIEVRPKFVEPLPLPG